MLAGAVLAAGLALGAQAAGDGATAEIRRGYHLFQAGDLEAARNAFERAVELAPSHAGGWKALGTVFAARSDWTQAEAAFRKACALDPREERACYYLGRTLYSENRFDAAIEVFQKTLPAEPAGNLWQVHRGLALALEAMGRDRDAERQFRESIRFDDGRSRPDEDPRIDYGGFLFRQGRSGEAVGPLEEAVKRSPGAPRALFELGRVFAQTGKLDAAAAYLEKAVEVDPEYAAAHLLLGKTYLRMGREAEGRRHLELGRKRAIAEQSVKE